MASFSRANMQAIFERGVLLGMCAERAANLDTCEAAKELAAEHFDNAFRSSKDQKAQKAKANSNFVDTAKMLEDWDKAGRPTGGGGFIELLLDLEARKKAGK